MRKDATFTTIKGNYKIEYATSLNIGRMRKNALGTEEREKLKDQKVGGEMRLKEGVLREAANTEGHFRSSRKT